MRAFDRHFQHSLLPVPEGPIRKMLCRMPKSSSKLHDFEKAVVIGLQSVFDAHLRNDLLIVPVALTGNIDAREKVGEEALEHNPV